MGCRWCFLVWAGAWAVVYQAQNPHTAPRHVRAHAEVDDLDHHGAEDSVREIDKVDDEVQQSIR